MRKRWMALLIAIFTAGMGPMSLPGGAHAAAKSLLAQLLSVVPASAAASLTINFADYRAIVAARPGATPLNSMDDWNAFQNSHSSGGALALAAISGLNADGNLANYFLSLEDGIDRFAIQRELDYGEPPSHLLLLAGDFNATAIGNALSAHGFIQSDMSDAAHNIAVWCNSQGCDKGAETDLSAPDPANPFGGNLGRKEPIAIVPGYVFGSASFPIFRDQLAAVQGQGSTLANVPDVAALSEAITAQGTLIQCQIFASEGIDVPFVGNLLNGTPTITQAPSLPAYSRVAIAQLVKDDSQLAIVALVYQQMTDAQTAAQVIPARLARYFSTVRRQSFMGVYSGVGLRVQGG